MVPQTMVFPSSVVEEPHMTFAPHAFASGRSMPPPMRWLPQLMCLFQAVGSATEESAPLANDFAS